MMIVSRKIGICNNLCGHARSEYTLFLFFRTVGCQLNRDQEWKLDEQLNAIGRCLIF